MNTEAIIRRAVPVEGSTNWVAYNEKHENYIGYWICKECKYAFSAEGSYLHRNDCSLQGRVTKTSKDHQDMIFVLGPNQDAYFFPFDKLKLESIVQLAKLGPSRL